MSALSDFLTHSSVPWWSPLVGTMVGGALTALTTRASDNRKDRQASAADLRKSAEQRAQHQREEVGKLCAQLLTEASSLLEAAEYDLIYYPLDVMEADAVRRKQAERRKTKRFVPTRSGPTPEELQATTPDRQKEIRHQLAPMRMMHSELVIHAPEDLAKAAAEVISTVSYVLTHGPWVRSLHKSDQLLSILRMANHYQQAFAKAARKYLAPDPPSNS